MPSWLIVPGFWGLSTLICLPVLMGGPARVAALVFLFLLIGLSTYLYSRRFAAFVDRILVRTNAA
jgi:hypothetical protein